MSPRIANKDRSELPKPQVQSGVVGFSPLNTLTLSYAYHDVGDRIVLIPEDKDTTFNAFGSTRHVVQVKSSNCPSGQEAETFDLQGKLLRGFSDGLYRGKLPEVIIASPSVTQLGSWLNELSDYLEKMLQFGFFLQENPVSRLFPNIVIVSEGIYFKRLMLALSKHLDNIPSLLPAWREQILAKCHRGVLLDQWGKPVSISAEAFSEPVSLEFPPMQIRIAANHPLFSYYVSPYFSAIESILTLEGFQVSLENSVPNAVERLELEYALMRTTSVLIPAIAKKTDQSKEVASLQSQVWNAIVSIGKLVQAFDNDTPLPPQETLPKAAMSSASIKTAGKKTKISEPSSSADVQVNTSEVITPTDVSLFDSLYHYAESLSLPKEKALFASMNRSVEQEWRKSRQ